MVPPEKDAYGREILDYFLGLNGMPEIVERDDGCIGLASGPSAYFAPYEKWPEPQQKVIQMAHGRILDAGCGAGRVCLYLQERGHEVVGIDNSPLAVKTAKLRGVQDARVLSITQASRAKLGVFGAIVMLGNNFGLFGNEKRAKWLLRRFYGMTTADGRILVESRDIYATDNPDHLAAHERNRQHGRMPGQLRIRIRYQSIIGPWFDYLMVSPEEMKEIVAGTGWQVGQMFEGEAGMYTAVIEKER